MIKKFFLFFFFAFILCGCTSRDENIINLKFSTWGSASEMAILKPIIRDFEKQNPDIKIELVHIPQNYFQKIHLLFASNLAPDIIFINNLNLPVYAKHLEPLKIDKNQYYQQAVNSLSYNSNILAIPRDISNLVIYYNKDLFDIAGEPYPDNTWTLDDLLKKSIKLTNKSHFGISFEDDVYYAFPYILTLGGDINNINTGMMFYKNLVLKYHCAPSKSDVGSKTLGQMFLEEKIAMHLSGRWLVPKYKESAKFNWDVVIFPGITPADASGWAISKDSKHKNEAKKFIEFLSSKENIQKMTSSGLIVPARIDVKFKDEVFLEAVKSSKVLNIPVNYNKLTDKINDTEF